MRFVPVEIENGNWQVFDNDALEYVRFGFNCPPLYPTVSQPATEWQNYHSAYSFCQRLERLNTINEV